MQHKSQEVASYTRRQLPAPEGPGGGRGQDAPEKSPRAGAKLLTEPPQSNQSHTRQGHPQGLEGGTLERDSGAPGSLCQREQINLPFSASVFSPEQGGEYACWRKRKLRQGWRMISATNTKSRQRVKDQQLLNYGADVWGGGVGGIGGEAHNSGRKDHQGP